MNKYKKRFILFFVIVVILYLFFIFFGTKTGNFVVQTSMSLVNSMIPTLIQNIPNQEWNESTNLTINLTYYFNDTNQINFSASSVQNITILMFNGTNITTLVPDIGFHGSRSVIFTATDGYESTNSNSINLIVDWVPNIDQGTFPVGTSNTTNFSAYTPVELQNISNVTIDSPTKGTIKFIENLNISDDVDLDSYVNISYNYIFINSTAIPSFNKAANLTLYGLTFTNPKILRDGSDCPATICAKIDYSSGTLEFNVTQFSAYSAAETTAGGAAGAAGGGGGGISRKIEKAKVEELKPFKRPGRLFDATLTIPDKYRELLSGEEIIGEVQIINMKSIGLVDVVVEYTIQDINEKVLYKEIETKSIEHEIDYVKKIEIPKEVPPGTYLLLANVRYNDDLAISGYPFKILEKPISELNYLIMIYSIIFLLTLVIFILVSYYYYKRLERRIKIKLNERDLEKLIKRRK